MDEDEKGNVPDYPGNIELVEAAIAAATPGDEIDMEPFGYEDDMLGWVFDEALRACHDLVRRGLPLIPEYHRHASEMGDWLRVRVPRGSDDLEPYRLQLVKEIENLQSLVIGVEEAQRALK